MGSPVHVSSPARQPRSARPRLGAPGGSPPGRRAAKASTAQSTPPSALFQPRPRRLHPESGLVRGQPATARTKHRFRTHRGRLGRPARDGSDEALDRLLPPLGGALVSRSGGGGARARRGGQQPGSLSQRAAKQVARPKGFPGTPTAAPPLTSPDPPQLLANRGGPRSLIRPRSRADPPLLRGAGQDSEQPDRWIPLETGYMGNSVYGLFCFRATRPDSPEAVKFLGLVGDEAEGEVEEAPDPVAAFGLGEADGFARQGIGEEPQNPRPTCSSRRCAPGARRAKGHPRARSAGRAPAAARAGRRARAAAGRAPHGGGLRWSPCGSGRSGAAPPPCAPPPAWRAPPSGACAGAPAAPSAAAGPGSIRSRARPALSPSPDRRAKPPAPVPAKGAPLSERTPGAGRSARRASPPPPGSPPCGAAGASRQQGTAVRVRHGQRGAALPGAGAEPALEVAAPPLVGRLGGAARPAGHGEQAPPRPHPPLRAQPLAHRTRRRPHLVGMLAPQHRAQLARPPRRTLTPPRHHRLRGLRRHQTPVAARCTGALLKARRAGRAIAIQPLVARLAAEAGVLAQRRHR